MKRLAILGSTGSIGTQTLSLVEAFPQEFQVVALASRRNVTLLAEQIRKFSPRLVAVEKEGAAEDLRRRLSGLEVEILWGPEGLVSLAIAPDVDLVVSAMVGTAGLLPTMAAIEAKKDVALANKEILVMGGELVMAAAKARDVRILPIDSEHSAIFQCLSGGRREEIKRVILTASGGPFRDLPRERFAGISPEEALRHPTWSMGPKVTIDSATLMNKGLEVIEAKWLFDLKVSQIEVLVHPQSIVHSMVEFIDGSFLAQLSITDMRLPILYALSYPERRRNTLPTLDLTQISSLTFEPVDQEKFPCLSLAYWAAEVGGTLPAVLNAANEVAVSLFLAKRIDFNDIPSLVEKAMGAHKVRKLGSIEEALEVDRQVRHHLGAEFGIAG
ncbi:MAG: 1-deoxy-D-xylulose-5-phosphate reductoisomerase [candidate division NC10 bacterium]|nr:1-deoxy-D-xylulose-5-phosphate reductoisomerase [candidate division NC10 bacterium]